MNSDKEAINAAKQLHSLSWISPELKSTLENDFPELKESEDEKIRKELISFLRTGQPYFCPNTNKRTEWANWVEKQKEQKESEDEKVRKAIWQVLSKGESTKVLNAMGVQLSDAFAYLEKQKEQKPAELPKSEDYGIDGLYAAIDILQKTLGEVEGYQSDDGILEHKCAISAVKELYEQQPAGWSEEEEKDIQEASDYLRDYANNIIQGGNSKLYLRSLADRIESLRTPPHWKPSEEQMSDLWRVAMMYTVSYPALKSLYNDLNNLL